MRVREGVTQEAGKPRKKNLCHCAKGGVLGHYTEFRVFSIGERGSG